MTPLWRARVPAGSCPDGLVAGEAVISRPVVRCASPVARPLRAHAGDPTPITQVKVRSRTKSSLDRDPGIATVVPGNAISRELTSLEVTVNAG